MGCDGCLSNAIGHCNIVMCFLVAESFADIAFAILLQPFVAGESSSGDFAAIFFAPAQYGKNFSISKNRNGFLIVSFAIS